MLYSDLNRIFCPLCREIHANHTQCQRNDFRMDVSPAKAMRTFANDLVTSYGKYDRDISQHHVSLADIPEHRQLQFASLCLDYHSDEAIECFCDDSITSALHGVLNWDGIGVCNDLVDAIRANTIKYFTPMMTEVLAQALELYVYDEVLTNNLHQYRDSDNELRSINL